MSQQHNNIQSRPPLNISGKNRSLRQALDWQAAGRNRKNARRIVRSSDVQKLMSFMMDLRKKI